MWLKLHDTSRDHYKIIGLADLLSVEPPMALGLLVSLWTWTLRMCEDGDLAGVSDRHIELAAQWRGEPGAFLLASVEAGLLDRDGDHYVIHDWMDYAGSLKSARNRRRQREEKKSKEGATVARQSHDSRTTVADTSETQIEVSHREERRREENEKREEHTPCVPEFHNLRFSEIDPDKTYGLGEIEACLGAEGWTSPIQAIYVPGVQSKPVPGRAVLGAFAAARSKGKGPRRTAYFASTMIGMRDEPPVEGQDRKSNGRSIAQRGPSKEEWEKIHQEYEAKHGKPREKTPEELRAARRAHIEICAGTQEEEDRMFAEEEADWAARGEADASSV